MSEEDEIRQLERWYFADDDADLVPNQMYRQEMRRADKAEAESDDWQRKAKRYIRIAEGAVIVGCFGWFFFVLLALVVANER